MTEQNDYYTQAMRAVTAVTPRRKPNRKRRNFVGVWLDDEELDKLTLFARLAGEPDSPSAGLRYALQQAATEPQ